MRRVPRNEVTTLSRWSGTTALTKLEALRVLSMPAGCNELSMPESLGQRDVSAAQIERNRAKGTASAKRSDAFLTLERANGYMADQRIVAHPLCVGLGLVFVPSAHDSRQPVSDCRQQPKEGESELEPGSGVVAVRKRPGAKCSEDDAEDDGGNAIPARNHGSPGFQHDSRLVLARDGHALEEVSSSVEGADLFNAKIGPPSSEYGKPEVCVEMSLRCLCLAQRAGRPGPPGRWPAARMSQEKLQTRNARRGDVQLDRGRFV